MWNGRNDINPRMIKKIVVIGPESTGKSTLCEQLAAHFQTSWCPEYAREYLLQHGMSYTYDDLLLIAKGQVSLEDEYLKLLESRQTEDDSVNTPAIIDTNMYVMKVWCEFVYDKCHRYILDQIVSREYDLYLLCDTDLPWVKDELREYPDLETRERLFKIYHDILINQSVPWARIRGTEDERLANALPVIERILKN